MAIQKADGVDAYNNFPSKFIKVYCRMPAGGAAVAIGDVVVLDTTIDRALLQTSDAYGLTVTRAGATANLPLACGVACEAIPANTTAADTYVLLQIQYAGYNDAVVAASAVATGLFVGTSATAAQVDDFTVARTNLADYFAVCVKPFTLVAGVYTDGALLIVDKGFFNG
jgi:hypothetical protein